MVKDRDLSRSCECPTLGWRWLEVGVGSLCVTHLPQEVDHGTTIWWSDFSCDGSMLCTASDDRSVRVYDCKTWKLLEMFGHGLPAKCASFSPDGQSVATASGDAFVRIFDLNEGDEAGRLLGRLWEMCTALGLAMQSCMRWPSSSMTAGSFLSATARMAHYSPQAPVKCRAGRPAP